MPNNLFTPIFEQKDQITGHCTGTVSGKRFVVVSQSPGAGALLGTENPYIKQVDTAGVLPLGVARYDGVLNDEIPIVSENEWGPLVAGAAVTAGQKLSVDNQGRVIPYVAGGSIATDPVVVALALEDQATVGNDVMCKIVCL